MPKLCDIQQAFAEAIVEGTCQTATAAMAADGSALRSLALYRRLIRNNFVQVLRITYPALHRLVDDNYFGVLARGYIKKYPSTSGDLFLYGRHLPAWLQRIEASPLLVELARLEWACHEVYQAADSVPFPPDRFQAMASADPSRVTIVVRSCGAVQVIPLAWLEYRLLEALSQGASVASIEQQVREAEAGVDFTRLMTTLLQAQVIAGISLKEGV